MRAIFSRFSALPPSTRSSCVCVCRDLTNGQCRVTCSHDDAVTHIEWAPNGEPFIFSSSVDKSIKSVDTTTISRTNPNSDLHRLSLL